MSDTQKRRTKKQGGRPGCFAVAGPVIAGRVKAANLPWVIEQASLAEDLNINRQSVQLINDLEAMAHAVPILRPSDVVSELMAPIPIHVVVSPAGLAGAAAYGLNNSLDLTRV